MTTTHYIARARDGRNLELPVEAQALGLKAGDQVSILVEMEEEAQSDVIPNHAALEALARIDEILEEMQGADGAETDRMIREARDGGMYGL